MYLPDPNAEEEKVKAEIESGKRPLNSWYVSTSEVPVQVYQMTTDYLSNPERPNGAINVEKYNGKMPSKKYAGISFDGVRKIWGEDQAKKDFQHLGEENMFDQEKWKPSLPGDGGNPAGKGGKLFKWSEKSTLEAIDGGMIKVKTLWEK